MESQQNRYAGFWKRMLAHNIDLLPILAICYILSILIPKSNFDFTLLAGTYLLYHTAFDASPWKGTPGKRWSGLQVTDEKGNRIHFLRSLLRNLSKGLSLILLFIGFILISFNMQRKGLHDYIAGTLVLMRSE